MRRLYFYILSSLALTSFAKSPTLYILEIPRVHTQKITGHYGRFVNAIEKSLKINFQRSYRPQRRAYNEFLKDSESCFFPFAVVEGGEVPDGVIVSKSIGDIELFAISKKGIPYQYGNVKKQSRAIRHIYEGVIQTSSVGTFYVQNESQLYDMLDRGRVNYIIESIPDTFRFFKDGEEGFLRKYQYSSDGLVTILKEYFACHNNELGKKVIGEIDKRL